MKTSIAMLLAFILSLTAQAQDRVLVEAIVVKHPASMTPGSDIAKWEKKTDVEILSRPRLTTRSGQEASIALGSVHNLIDNVSTAHAVSSQALSAGTELRVIPHLQDENVTFTGAASIRESEGLQLIPGGEMTEFLERQYHFSGSGKTGQTFVFSSKGVHERKRVSLLLTFTKL